MKTFDQMQIDAAQTYLVHELEKLDPKVHEPLVSFTWGRDVPLRSDVTIGDEISSFVRDYFASPGTESADDLHFISTDTTQISLVQQSLEKTPNPLFPWAIGCAYSVFDLVRSQTAGRPLDQSQTNKAQKIYNLEADQIAYIGNARRNMSGLLNHSDVTVYPASTKTGGGTAWGVNTPAAEILGDINTILLKTTESANEVVSPRKILMPLENYSMLVSRRVGGDGDGSKSLLTFVLENNLSGPSLEIDFVKWAKGAGAAGVNRMIAYTPEEDFLRIPITPTLRTPIQQLDLWFRFVYYCVMGGLEVVYPETIGYMDGI